MGKPRRLPGLPAGPVGQDPMEPLLHSAYYRPAMAHIILAVFLVVFGLNIMFGLAIPMWVIGLLALIAGVLLMAERFRVRVDRK
jgi:uncharacterized membrane protein HdeD (DUF308 family)